MFSGTSRIFIGRVEGLTRYKDMIRTLNSMKIHYHLHGTLSKGYWVYVKHEDKATVEDALHEWRERTKT